MSGKSAVRRFGVLIPSTNTAVEAEFNDLRTSGVSWHAGRIPVRQSGLGDDQSFSAFVEGLDDEVDATLRDVLSAQVEHVVLATSAQVFWGGRRGAAEIESRLRSKASGCGVTTAATALLAALRALGVSRVGVLTPYQPIGDERLRTFLEESGVEVVAMHSLRVGSLTDIANQTPDAVRDGFARVNVPAAEALIQVGTNLPCAQIAVDLEKQWGKPVVPLSTAFVWHAYRTRGIDEPLVGWGTLLAEH